MLYIAQTVLHKQWLMVAVYLPASAFSSWIWATTVTSGENVQGHVHSTGTIAHCFPGDGEKLKATAPGLNPKCLFCPCSQSSYYCFSCYTYVHGSSCAEHFDGHDRARGHMYKREIHSHLFGTLLHVFFAKPKQLHKLCFMKKK